MFPKLLRITNEMYQPEILVESKSYITVRIGKSLNEEHLYWQLVDPVFSLLQLGFELSTGRLVHCSVPLFNGEVEAVEVQPLQSAVAGVPHFDVSAWPVKETKGKSGSVMEQPGRIRLRRSSNALAIVAQEVVCRRSVAYGETVVCHFDRADELIGLTLRGNFSF